MGSIIFGPSIRSRRLAFFPFKFLAGEGGGKGFFFFHFSLVPNVFSSMFLSVPNGFSSSSQYVPPSSQCVPEHVLHSTSLLSHMLWQMLSSFRLYNRAKGVNLQVMPTIAASIVLSKSQLLFFPLIPGTYHKVFLTKEQGNFLSVWGGTCFFKEPPVQGS